MCEDGKPPPTGPDDVPASPGPSIIASVIVLLCTSSLNRIRSQGFSGLCVSRCVGQDMAGLLFASDSVATRLNELHSTLNDSPASTAVRTAGPVLISDLRAETSPSWTPFAAEAQRWGIRGVYAIPVHIGAVSLGVVCAYSTDPTDASPVVTSELLRLSDSVGNILLMPHGLDPQSAQWARTFVGEQEMVTHQAAGMVMVQSRSTLKDAMVLLRAAAFSSEMPLNEIARQVVSRERSFVREDSEPGPRDGADQGCADDE